MKPKSHLSLEERFKLAADSAVDENNSGNKEALFDSESKQDNFVASYSEPTKEKTNESSFVYQEPTKTSYDTTVKSTYEEAKKENYVASSFDFSSYTQQKQTSSSTEELSKNNILKIVQLIDTYRSFSEREKAFIFSFSKVEKIGTEQDKLASLLKAILDINTEDKECIKQLMELKQEERTSRAFTLVSLSESRLESLQRWLLHFSSTYTEKNMENRILFCRELEKGIENLSEDTVSLIKPLFKLFSI